MRSTTHECARKACQGTPTCMAPAPSTSWQVRLLNTLSSSRTRWATSAANAGTASLNARYSPSMLMSTSSVSTTW